jgi:cellulose 1,4-beta-cellobiosidase
MKVTNVRVRLLIAMGVLLVGLLVLATQCPNSSSSLVAVLSASPTSGTSPLTVNFDASSSSGPDGSILTYEWSFGDGGTGAGETISHTYRQPGVYTAQLTAIDANGNMDSTSCEITVTAAVGTPPSAGFTATPSSGEVPLAVNFNASASFDPDGSITSYAWSFDDGANGLGVTATHTYTSAALPAPTIPPRLASRLHLRQAKHR